MENLKEKSLSKALVVQLAIGIVDLNGYLNNEVVVPRCRYYMESLNEGNSGVCVCARARARVCVQLPLTLSHCLSLYVSRNALGHTAHHRCMRLNVSERLRRRGRIARGDDPAGCCRWWLLYVCGRLWSARALRGPGGAPPCVHVHAGAKCACSTQWSLKRRSFSIAILNCFDG